MTLARPRNTAIPAALQPKARPELVVPSLRTPMHIAIVVPDARIYPFIRDRVYILGPTTRPDLKVSGHVMLSDPSHAGARLEHFMRWAVVETGLVTPDEVGLVAPVQIEWGWENHEARE